MKTYNRGMRLVPLLSFAILIAFNVRVFAQQGSNDTFLMGDNKLSKASLWNHYSFDLQASGGSKPYHWRIRRGTLPHGVELDESGKLLGTVEEQGQWNLSVAATDQGGKTQEVPITFSVEAPLATAWSRHAQVNGQRIDGSIKVSNTTGRDFDLTFVVLAVNDIGRATAIGYQHFALKSNTRDQELPFGENLSPGNYVVNVDVVGEEPQSNMIFRARLVSEKEAITQGP